MYCPTSFRHVLALGAMFLIAIGFLPAQAGGKVDVSGTWKADFDTQKGLQKYTFTFKQEGNKILSIRSTNVNLSPSILPSLKVTSRFTPSVSTFALALTK